MVRKQEQQTVPKVRRPDRRQTSATEALPTQPWELRLALCLVMSVLIYSPYLRGLFFPTEQEWTLVLVAGSVLLLWAGKIRQREVSFVSRPFDYLALAWVGLYGVSLFGAASQRLAVAELIKVATYVSVYWAVSQLGREAKYRLWLLGSMYLAAVGVAVAGILVAQGMVSIKDGFVGGRIYSTLQYPNALASYLAAASFCGWVLWAGAQRIARFLLSVGTFLLLMVFLATGSRGALLLYPIVLALFFGGVPAEKRAPLLMHALGSWAAALIAAAGFLPSVVAGDHSTAWQWLVFGLGAALAVQGGYEAVGWFRGRYGGKRLVWASLLVVLVAGLALAVAFYFGGPALWLPRLVPDQLAARFRDLSWETFSAATRLQWSLDALQLVKARPWLGYGGGAWEAAYQSVQSYYYTSTQVHNHYFQVWTEVGTVGLAVFLGLWVCFLATAVANGRRGSATQRLYQWGVLCAGLGLGLHAVLDFDLALGAVALVLWTCFGLTRGLERELRRENYFLRRQEYIRVRPRYLAAAVMATLVLAWLPGSLLIGEAVARRAVAAVQTGQTGAAVEYFRTASRFDPFRGSYLADQAGLLAAAGRFAEAVALAEKAAAKEPLNSRILARLGEVYWAAGQPDRAVEAMERARSAARWAKEGWENLGRVAAMAGIYYLRNEDTQRARPYLEKAMSIPLEVRSTMAGLSAERLRLWKEGGRPLLEVTPYMELNAAIGAYGLGRFEEALRFLERPMQVQEYQGEACYWASLAHRRLNHQAEAEELRRRAEDLAPHLVSGYEEMVKLPTLSFEGAGP
ncbi:MAG: O-antigen ligase family protein [Moorellales bacterium]